MDSEPDRHSTSSSNSPHGDMPPQVFACSYPDCHFKSARTENVRRHEKRHDPTREWYIRCQVCPRILNSLFGFFYHVSKKHSNELLCSWCFFHSEDFPEFKAHVLAHRETQPISTGPSSSRNGPFHSFKAQRPFYCSTGFKSFGHNQMNHYHSNSFTNYIQKQAVCNPSQESFETPEFPNPMVADETLVPVDETQSEEAAECLIEKVNYIEGETFYSCTICSHKTKRRDNLKTHFLVHTDHRPFGCPVSDCKYRAKLFQHLKRHSKVVHNVNILPAKENPETLNENLGLDMDCANQTQDNVSRNDASLGFACMLCDFIGDSELAAMEHAQQHKILYS